MYTYDYPRPMVTVDVVVFLEDGNDVQVLVIRRKNGPFQGNLAFPGGFVDANEDLKDAALRELKEETGLSLDRLQLKQLGAFGKPGRDPRGHTISVVFVGFVGKWGAQSIVAGDDACDAFFVPLRGDLDLAFDHGDILREAIDWRNNL